MLPPDSSEVNPDPPSGPPVTSSVEMPEAASDPKPNPDNTPTPEGIQRRSLGGWFRRMMKSNRNRSHEIPSEDFSQTGAPQAKPPPSNQKASIITPGQRIRVSLPCLSDSSARISDYLAQRVVQWIGDEPPVRTFVYWCMNIMTNWSSQEPATQETPPAGEQSKVTPSGEQPKATAQSNVDPANPPDDTKQASSGVQHTIEVMVFFMPSEAKAHGDYF